MGRSVIVRNVLRSLALFGLGALASGALSPPAHACGITAPTNTADRRVSISLAGCAGVGKFMVSESPDFGRSAGVKVQITGVAPDQSYADLKIEYPGGVQGGSPVPFSVASEQRTIRALAVIFTFEDSEGRIPELAPFQTPKFVQRLVFGDGVAGFDGYFKNASMRDHLFQSTHGRVLLTGEAYPTVVRLPLERFRRFLEGEMRPFDREILLAIEASNPGYLASKNFDFLLAFSSEGYSVVRNLYQISASTNVQNGEFGTLRHSAYTSIPLASTSELVNLRQETRTSRDATTVVTGYNPDSSGVEGVWLATDVNRTGINYFAGGSVKTTSNTQYNWIQLGTALPSPNVAVTVRYRVQGGGTESRFGPDWLFSGSWFQHRFHEVLHAISKVPAFRMSDRGHLGDLYNHPARIRFFDPMDTSGTPALHPLYNRSYSESALLSGHSRMILGHVKPLTLKYGENQASLRIHRAELADGSATTLIKVPLRPVGDPGLSTMRTMTGLQVRQFRGEEYLLLEWRYRGVLPNEAHNFDRNLPSEGLVIYRVIESGVTESVGAASDIVRVVDATPPEASDPDLADDFSDTAASPAAFGPQSGVFSYTSRAYAQEKMESGDAHAFEHLLSAGTGTKTLYAKFASSSGLPMGQAQVVIESSDSSLPSDRLPTLTLSLAPGTVVSSFLSVAADYAAPNTPKSVRFFVDGVLKLSKDGAFLDATRETFSLRPGDYSVGSHQLSVVFYDGGLNRKVAETSFIVPDGADSTAPSVSIPTFNDQSSLSGVVNTSIEASDGRGVARVELWIDGTRLLGSTSSSPYFVSWDSRALSNGSHSLMAKAYDAAGSVGIASKSVTISNDGATPSPSPSPSPTATPSPSPSPSPTATPSPSPSPSPTVTPSPSPSPSPTATPSPSPSPSPTVTPSPSPSPTAPPPDTQGPTVWITSPTSGSLVAQRTTVVIQATVYDSVGVRSASFYVNGALICTNPAGSNSCSWKVPTGKNKSYTLTVTATDLAGNLSTSLPVTVKSK